MRFMDKLQQKLFIHAEKEFMGLMAFAGNQPTLKETVIAKNYLNEKELRAMGQLVSWYLDFAERQAEWEQAMTMSIGQSIWIVTLQLVANSYFKETEVLLINKQLIKQRVNTEYIKPEPSVMWRRII